MRDSSLTSPPAWTAVVALSLIASVSPAADPTVDATGKSGWINVTGSVGGESWGYAGVCRMAAVPDSRRVIAGVSEAGLWASDDGGSTWSALNQKGTGKITHRTYDIVFDPKDSKVIWVSGSYGPGVFKSADGGESFERLGALDHVDGIAIDFIDPRRSTLVVGLHEQTLSLQKSTDGGATWRKIGDKLPADSNFPSDPILLSDKVLITNTSGWAQKKTWGILRSEDGGETWQRVSAAGPGGPALVASDGKIYWPMLWKSGLLKSGDGGKTWKEIKTPTTSSPIELPGRQLAALGGDRVYRSTDGGETWQPLGPKLPQKSSGVIYSTGLRSFFAWRSSEKKVPDAIFRWDEATVGPEQALAIELTGPAVVEPGSPPEDLLKATNGTDAPIAAFVEFSVQRDEALFSRKTPDPIHGSDHALGTRSWTEVDGRTIEEGSLTDGKDWTSAGTDWIRDHFAEAFQTIDLGRVRRITRMTWLSGDANWVDRADVSASLDGKEYAAVPSLRNIDMKKKWGTQVFPLAEPFRARFVRLRYHQGGAKATVIRMPAAIGIYDGVEDESLALPEVGRVVVRGTSTLEVPPRGLATLPITGAGPLKPGAYLVAAKLDAGGRTYLAWRNLLVLPRPWKRSGTSRLGLNAADAGVHGLLERLGIGWVRFENLKWPFVSSEKGVFRFDGSIGPWHVDLDHMFESYRSHGLDILPFLFLTQDYDTPPGASPDGGKLTQPPKDFAGYAEFAFQTAARYGSTVHPPEILRTPDKKSGLGLIRVYELWNEPNLNDPSWGHWKGSLERYYDMFRLGAEAVRRADPKALVANGGFSGIGVELVDTLRSYTFGDGRHPLDFIDVLSVHFYTGRSLPETARINANTGTFGSTDPRTFEENLELLIGWRDRHKPGMPVWLTETGYETGAEFGVDERTQAAWLVRDVLTVLASGVEKVMVFREVGTDPGRWGSAGVIRSDRTLKPSYFSYATLVREMDGVEGGSLRLAAGKEDVRVHAWSRGGKTILTAWALEGTAPFPLRLGKAAVTDSFGGRREVDTEHLTLTDFPVYIRDVTEVAILDALLAEAREEEARRKAAQRRQAALEAYLFDFGSMEHVGGFVIGDYRRCRPVIARDTWDESKGYGFFPAAALQDDDQAWIGDPLERDSCRMAKGIGFRFRAKAGRYVLRVRVVPFEPSGRLSIGGISGGSASVEVTKEKGLAEVEVEVGESPVTVEMDGYASLRWLALVQKPSGDR